MCIIQFELQNESGNYEYTYLYVMVNHVGTIVIENNKDNIKIQQDEELMNV